MPTKFVTKPPRVPRCPIRGHSDHVSGCKTCIDFSRYDYRRRQYEAHIGLDVSLRPAGPVADHLNKLVSEGNWRLVDIIEQSGISRSSVEGILHRRTRKVLPVTEESLMALQPRPALRPPMSTLVPGLEASRIARGLAAQGWSLKHMSRVAGYKYHDTFATVAREAPPWVAEETLLNLRAVAEKLGRFDLARLDKPLPGMFVLTFNMARERGWEPLSAWAGRDITAPDVPSRATADDDLAETSTWSYIDPILTLRVADALDTVRKTDREAGRRHDGFINSVGRLTRIEAHAVVEYAVSLKLNTVDTARLLGYSMPTKQKEGNAQRSVERMKVAMRTARGILSQLAAGDQVDPAWCLRLPNGDGFHQFSAVAAALLAVQGQPFGPGWSPAELAGRAGVGEGAMHAFLAYATRRGDAVWTPHEGTHQQPAATTVPDVVPVDLGELLAA